MTSVPLFEYDYSTIFSTVNRRVLILSLIFCELEAFGVLLVLAIADFHKPVFPAAETDLSGVNSSCRREK